MANFVFDKKTGTMVAEKAAVLSDVKEKEDLVVPVSDRSENIVKQAPQANVEEISEEDEIVFRKYSDMSIMRIDDEATNQWLCYFSGYALDIRFNIEELKKGNGAKKIEAALEGLTKLFRKLIYEQALGD